MKKEVKERFLVDSAETGRHIVHSVRTGKKYGVETLDKVLQPADWGSYNPSTGNIENKKGHGKFTGAIHPKDSLITEENGFINIREVKGGSPYSLIEEIDSQYPSI